MKVKVKPKVDTPYVIMDGNKPSCVIYMNTNQTWNAMKGRENDTYKVNYKNIHLYMSSQTLYHYFEEVKHDSN